MNQSNTVVAVATPFALAKMNDTQLAELHDRIGKEGMDALIVADEAREARQEAAAQRTPVVIEAPRILTLEEKREALAEACGKEFPPVAAALRGELVPVEAVKALNWALQNRAFSSASLGVIEDTR